MDINTARDLGYNSDLRKGSAKYFHDLVKEHKRAAKLGFDSASWNRNDVRSFLRNKIQLLKRKMRMGVIAMRFVNKLKNTTKNDLNVTINDNTVVQYVNNKLRQRLVANLVTYLDFTFASNTYFAQVEHAMQQIMASVDVVLPAVLQKFAFLLKLN